MTRKAYDLLNKFIDECIQELNTVNISREVEVAEDMVMIEHKLQLMKKYLK